MTYPSIYKCPRIIVGRPNETSPFVMNGEVLMAMFARNGRAPEYYEIRRFRTGEVLKHGYWSGIFGCALVVDGVVHIWGATGGTANGNSIIHSTLDANWNTVGQDTSYHSDPSYESVSNSSVCYDGSKFVMVVESAGRGIIFLQSTSPYGPWTSIGATFRPGTYAASPTLKFCDGMYYMTYLKATNAVGKQDTGIVRSATLAAGSWQDGQTILTADEGEGINNSDFDFVEFNGMVRGAYFDGDQATWLNVRRCMYDGTVSQMFQDLFS